MSLRAALAAVHYALRVKGESEPFQQSPEGGLDTPLHHGGVCKAFDLALKKMKKGEKAGLDIAPACMPPHTLCCPLPSWY